MVLNHVKRTQPCQDDILEAVDEIRAVGHVVVQVDRLEPQFVDPGLLPLPLGDTGLLRVVDLDLGHSHDHFVNHVAPFGFRGEQRVVEVFALAEEKQVVDDRHDAE